MHIENDERYMNLIAIKEKGIENHVKKIGKSDKKISNQATYFEIFELQVSVHKTHRES